MCVNSGEQDWVCCDKCSVWYHCVCAGILEVAKQSDFQYFCFVTVPEKKNLSEANLILRYKDNYSFGLDWAHALKFIKFL